MRTFEEMWAIAKDYGASLEDLARELYDRFKTEQMKEETLQTLINFVYELKALDDYFTENKLDVDRLPSIFRRIRDHKHVDGQVVLPMEIDP